MSNLKDWLQMDFAKLEGWIFALNEEIHYRLKRLRNSDNKRPDDYDDLICEIKYLQGKRDALKEIQEWIRDDLSNTED